MPEIHPSAVVDKTAHLGSGVTVGPLAVVEAGVVIGDGCSLAAHVVVKSGTILGQNNVVCEYSVLGGRPQYLAAGAEVGTLVIGDNNTIREQVTIHRGLTPEQRTTVGSHNMLMVSSHIGHACHIDTHIIMANNLMLGGHVMAQDHIYFGGAAAVHQFCRVGKYAMVGGQARVTQDVPPYVMIDGATTRVVGLNRIGLKRKGFTDDQLLMLKQAYRIIYRCGLSWKEVLETLDATFASPLITEWRQFLTHGERGFVRERHAERGSAIKLFTQGDGDDNISKAG